MGRGRWEGEEGRREEEKKGGGEDKGVERRMRESRGGRERGEGGERKRERGKGSEGVLMSIHIHRFVQHSRYIIACSVSTHTCQIFNFFARSTCCCS